MGQGETYVAGGDYSRIEAMIADHVQCSLGKVALVLEDVIEVLMMVKFD